MSKLTIIRQSLETNPEVIIAKVFEKNGLPEESYWSHWIEFYVAPKNGLYTAEELQAFMESLVPDRLEPSLKYSFRQHEYNRYSHSDFTLGRLGFDEEIGQQRLTRICTLTDEELFNVSGFVNGQRTIERTIPYWRRIFVKPFPNEAFVKRFVEDYGTNLSEVLLGDVFAL